MTGYQEAFDNPVAVTDKQDHYSRREVGLSHPDVAGFIRIRDNGDVEICAGDGLAILMHPKTGTITFVADHINFITRSDSGLKWNHVAFNEKATSFKEPTFIASDPNSLEAFDTYEGVESYLRGIEEEGHTVWVRDNLGNKMSLDEYADLLRDKEKETDPDGFPDYSDAPAVSEGLDDGF